MMRNAKGHLAVAKVDVLDAKLDALHQAHARAIHELRHSSAAASSPVNSIALKWPLETA